MSRHRDRSQDTRRPKHLVRRVVTLGAILFVAPAVVPTAATEAHAASAVCANAARKVAYDYKGRKDWDASSVNKLCGNVKTREPAKCFKTIMHGGVSWGGGTRWRWQNALDLCQSSGNANATVQCFKSKMPKVGWRKAVASCKKTKSVGGGVKPSPPAGGGKQSGKGNQGGKSKQSDKGSKSPSKVPLGGRCEHWTWCKSKTCDAGPKTANTQLCVPPRKTGKPGEFCTHGMYCKSRRCNLETRRCEGLKANGKHCNDLSECKSKTCDAGPGTGNTSLCVPKRGTGGRGAFCTSNIYCKSSKCDLKARKCL